MSRLPRVPVACLALACMLLPACTASAPELQFLVRPYSEIRHAAGTTPDPYELGRRYQAGGQLDLAVGAYMQAMKVDHRATEARNALAVLYSRQGRFAEAVTLLRDAATKSSSAYLHNNLGYIYFLQGDHLAAIREFRAALTLEPGHPWARNNLRLATTALDRHSTQRVEQSPDRAASTAAAIEVWGEVRGRQDKVEGTVAAAREATRDKPTRAVTEVAPRTSVAQVLKPLKPMDINSNHPKLLTGGVEPVRFASSVRTSIPHFAASAPGKVRLEVSNGNGVTGFAKRMSEILVRHGIPVHSLTNQLPFKQLTTEIQYRDGFEQEANQLKTRLGGNAVVARSNTLRSHIDVRVLLGHDITTRISEIDAGRPSHLAISN